MIQPDLAVYEASESHPPCPHYGAYLRPDVVWFGEQINKDAMMAAIAYAGACEVFFAIGTSAQLLPALVRAMRDSPGERV